MSEQHTPGPWQFDISRGRVSHRPSPLTEYVIADLENDFEANGPLIAAAPDMLAMLIEAAEFIQPFNRAEELLDRIDMVIAKARGAS